MLSSFTLDLLRNIFGLGLAIAAVSNQSVPFVLV